jgi:hypothetical protein
VNAINEIVSENPDKTPAEIRDLVDRRTEDLM